jgi:hypothetical protein
MVETTGTDDLHILYLAYSDEWRSDIEEYTDRLTAATRLAPPFPRTRPHSVGFRMSGLASSRELSG